MESPSFITLSRLNALTRQMEVVSNNIANVNTTGFKRQNVMFENFVIDAGKSQQLDYVVDRASYRDTRSGPLTTTGNPLDVAIKGDGYFTVKTPAGDRYTRAGNFQRVPDGSITTSEGNPVLSDGGAPIVIPANTRDITINRDGTIITDTGPIGRLQLVSFPNQQILQEEGGGLYRTDGTTKPIVMTADKANINQGFIEGSNVEAVTEMTQMIEISRNYQSAQRGMDGEHERLRNMIQRLGRVV